MDAGCASCAGTSHTRSAVGNLRLQRLSPADDMAHFCILLLLLGSASSLLVSAQEGFLSLDCGGFGHVDQVTGIAWISDPGYVFTGNESSVRISTWQRELRTLRYFPKASTPVKNCFDLPVLPGSVYLIRAGFMYGDYDSPLSSAIRFQTALDSTPWQNVSINTSSELPLYHEAIIGPRNYSVSVCLIRTDEAMAPFINSLELRLLPQESYLGNRSDVNLYLVSRANFGEINTIRYPADKYDRVWSPYSELFPELSAPTVSFDGIIGSPAVGGNEPPTSVMQTAITGPFLSWSRRLSPASISVYSYTYFAQPTTTLSIRTIAVSFNGVVDSTFSLDSSKTFVEVPDIAQTDDLGMWSTTVSRAVDSPVDAIVNADELYLVHAVSQRTQMEDLMALLSIKNAMGLQRWLGDPCFPVSWDELTCTSDRVTGLNLSGQNLVGSIPSSIANLLLLNNLNLSNNHLSGTFPTWITTLPFLQLFDISNNELTGTFPASLTKLGENFRYSGNPGLQCAPDGSTQCPTNLAETSGSTGSGPSKIRKIIGAVFGVVGLATSVAGAIALIILCCRPRMVQHVGIARSGSALGTYGEQLQLRSFNNMALPVLDQAVVGHPVPVGGGKARMFSITEIQVATTNYSRKIGVGGFGPVFYGVLDDQREVAVKLLSSTSRQGYKEFLNEIELLSTVYHRNLVSLVGYCQESTELILLYEYMSGGNLQNRLYGSLAKPFPLSWRQRLQVALDAARGLEYLHHYCKPAIIHRDVKSANILLTNALEAKITDFGFSKLTPEGADHVTTVVRGTKGYVDPEYSHSGMLTDKSDVYSFGVVLLEIVTGQPPIDLSPNTPVDQKFIVNWVRTAARTGNLGNVTDRSLPLYYSQDAAWKFVEVAMMCVEGSGARRPSMMQVVRELTETLEIEMRSTITERPNGAPHPALYAGISRPK